MLTDEESPDFIREYNVDSLLQHIQILDTDINNPHLPQGLVEINSNELTVIHVAASTNLMQGDNAEQDVYLNNNLATKNLLASLPHKLVKSFVYISTAYSCGVQQDISKLGNDYQDLEKTNFRNPYERNKAEIEDYLVRECKILDIDLKILRPAVVCGRLIDAPLYCTTKFDVFYGWAKFFYKMKSKFENEKMGCTLPIELIP